MARGDRTFWPKESMRYFQKGQIALFEVADLVGLGKIPAGETEILFTFKLEVLES